MVDKMEYSKLACSEGGKEKEGAVSYVVNMESDWTNDAGSDWEEAASGVSEAE